MKMDGNYSRSSWTVIIMNLNRGQGMQQHKNALDVGQRISRLQSSTWQQKIQIITSLPQDSNLVKMINSRNYSNEIIGIFNEFNPRSKVVITLCQFLIQLFSKFSSELLPFANVLISRDGVLKLLSCGNKVIADAVNQLCKGVIMCMCMCIDQRRIKFVNELQNEFLSSKNPHVRERISMYLLFIFEGSNFYADANSVREFYNKIIKKGIEDSSQQVRKNMKIMYQRAKEIMQDQSAFSTKRIQQSVRKSNAKSKAKAKVNRQHRRSHSRQPLSNLNLNLESVTSEIKNSKIITQQLKYPHLDLDKEKFLFNLNKIKTEENWQLRLVFFNELCSQIQDGILFRVNDIQLGKKCFQQLYPSLGEKRSKVYIQVEQMCLKIISYLKQANNQQLIAMVQSTLPRLFDYAMKFTPNFIPRILQLNPIPFVLKLAQFGLDTNIIKQKAMALKIVLKMVEERGQRDKKIVLIAKIMCQIIDRSTSKEISADALSVISILKRKYREQILGMLVCQNNAVLSKIFAVSECIDLSLKKQILQYISLLKGGGGTGQTNQYSSLNAQIEVQMRQILKGNTSLNRLAQMIFKNSKNISASTYKNVISLIEEIEDQTSIMELRIVLEELAKMGDSKFREALLMKLQEVPSASVQLHLKEVHYLLYLQLLQTTIYPIQTPISPNPIQSLIKAYRCMPAPAIKIRKAIIAILAHFSEDVLTQCLTSKQIQLVQAYAQ